MIDFHTHCYPDKIADKAIHSLSASAGGIHPQTDGTIAGLKSVLSASGIQGAVVLNIATNPDKNAGVNDFASSLNSPSEGIFAFGSVHPDNPGVMEELERIKALGLKGVKFQPAFQRFYADEDRMVPIYRKIASLGLITVIHVGADLSFSEVFCSPSCLAGILKHLDGAPVVAAHMGGCFMWEEAERRLADTPVYIDTSFSYTRIPYPTAKRMIRRFGAGRVLFGSDSPWSGISEELNLLLGMGLEREELDMILSENAQRLLGL